MKILTSVGVEIEVVKTDEGKVLWFLGKVKAFELTNEEAHKLAMALLGAEKLPHYLDTPLKDKDLHEAGYD